MAGFDGVTKLNIWLAESVKLYLDVRQTKSNAVDRGR
jgi:hypothetical protein